MTIANRVTEFYQTQHLVPFDEVETLRKDAYHDGYRNSMSLWFAIAVIAFLFGVMLGVAW